MMKITKMVPKLHKRALSPNNNNDPRCNASSPSLLQSKNRKQGRLKNIPNAIIQQKKIDL